MEPMLLAHAGAGSPSKFRDATEKAAKRGFSVLKNGGTALDAVVEAIAVLEDDPRFNAGTGSNLRLDGSVKMDAAVMTSDLECGAVAALEFVRNPIRVAREVMRTPHVLLAGGSSMVFAREHGFEWYDPITERTVKKLQKVKRNLKTGDLPKWAQRWRGYSIGTVGAVARDANSLATGVSTGGTSFMLPGRVGDSALIGCGLYANEHGAVSATGMGEEIIRHVLSKTIYDRLLTTSAIEACRFGVDLLAPYPTGVLALTPDDYAMVSNEDMACTTICDEGMWSGCSTQK